MIVHPAVPSGTCHAHAHVILTGRLAKPNGRAGAAGQGDLFAWAQRVADAAPPTALQVRSAPEPSRLDPGFVIPPLEDEARLMELVRRGALVVVNHSGGKDSQAMLDAMIARGVPRAQLLVVHADLGEVEWQGTRKHAEEHAKKYGVPFLAAKARIGADLAKRLGRAKGSEKTFMDMVDSRFLADPTVPCFPSPKYRQCTSDLKRGPLDSAIIGYARAHGHTLIVSAVGLRAAESPNRAKAPIWRKSANLSKRGREWWVYLPIHRLKRDQVFKIIAAAGGRPHWAYAAGNERLSCVFCIMGSKGDLRRGAVHNPDLFETYVTKERQTGHTLLMSGEPLEQAIGMTVADARKHRVSLPVLQARDYERLSETSDEGADGCTADDAWDEEGERPARGKLRTKPRKRPG